MTEGRCWGVGWVLFNSRSSFWSGIRDATSTNVKCTYADQNNAQCSCNCNQEDQKRNKKWCICAKSAVQNYKLWGNKILGFYKRSIVWRWFVLERVVIGITRRGIELHRKGRVYQILIYELGMIVTNYNHAFMSWAAVAEDISSIPFSSR